MLSQDQIETDRRDGFIVVEGVLSAVGVAALREVTDSFVERARSVTEHDHGFDLEPSHTLAPKYAGSIYEPQPELKNSYFAPSRLAKAMT
jgi:phytanoyl-CoA hydroxylase